MRYGRFRPAPDVVATILNDEEGALIDSRTMLTYKLNPTGVFVWNLIDQGCPVPRILTKICDTFEVHPRRAEEELARFVEEMKRLDLIECGPE